MSRRRLCLKKTWILLLLLLLSNLIQVILLQETILSNVQTAIIALQMKQVPESRLLEVMSCFAMFAFVVFFST